MVSKKNCSKERENTDFGKIYFFLMDLLKVPILKLPRQQYVNESQWNKVYQSEGYSHTEKHPKGAEELD